MRSFKKNQQLEFCIGGDQIKGKYISMIENKVIKIEITYDSFELKEIGSTCNIHQSFLLI